uniref:Putative ubiquinol cytochrome c reductase subunit qcr2 n=1 Tax=Tabanus bromius TaxID=304241 RepID=A0A0K8TU22_TABBR
MACNASKSPLLRIISKRGYSAQASPKAAGRGNEIQTTTLPNKLVVATADSNLPVSRVSVVFRAGSRHESYDNLGIAHTLRVAAGLTTKRSTAFAITRNIQQIGGSLTATGDRETIAYTVQVTSDHLETGIRFLQDVATAPAFKPWELSDSVTRIRVDCASIPDDVRAVELLHKAAFRSGLGNSLFCPSHNIGRLSSEALQHYFASNCTTNRCAVVGVGVEHRLLAGFAQNFDLESGAGKDVASKYYGGAEHRKDKSGRLAHVAIAGEGGSAANLKEALTFAVLQCAAGAGPSTYRGNVNGTIGKAVTSALGSEVFSFSALNASYSDSGLFGFALSTDAKNIGKGVEAGVKALKSANVSAEDVNRGKAQLKAAILHQHGTDGGLLCDMATQAALLGGAHGASELIAVVDTISQADVQAAARRAGSSKLSMGAVGNLGHVPHVTDLV